MDDRGDPTGDRWEGRYVAPVGQVGRRASVAPWVVVVAAALVLAVVKPWGSIAGPVPSGTATGSPAVPESATNDPDLLSRCHNTDAWLLSTVETSRGKTVRVLRVLSPVAATTPDDPEIQRLVVRVGAGHGAWLVRPGRGSGQLTGRGRRAGVVDRRGSRRAAGHPRGRPGRQRRVRDALPRTAAGRAGQAEGTTDAGRAGDRVMAERRLRVHGARHRGRRPHLRHRPRDHPAARPGGRRSDRPAP